MGAKRIPRTIARLRQIASYGATGFRWRDAPNLAVLGLARHHSLSESDLPSRLLHRIYPTLIVRPAQLKGLRVELDPADVSHMMIFDELFIERVYDFSAIPFKPDLICDCGAHIGMFTLLASAVFPGSPIMAFEPNPDNARRVRRQIDINHLKVDFRESAVSVADGESWFESDCSHGGALQSSNEATAGRYRVKVDGLAALIQAGRPSRLLLKIDIEGEEVNLIPAVLPVLPKNCVIFFETHSGEAGWSQAAQCLGDGGFNVRRTRENEQWMDGVALRT